MLSGDIDMEFGTAKCGVLVLKRGKVVNTDGIELPNRETIKEVEEDGYRYLGVLESDKVKEKEMKKTYSGEYFRRVKLILKSKLNGTNKIMVNVEKFWQFLVSGGGALKRFAAMNYI